MRIFQAIATVVLSSAVGTGAVAAPAFLTVNDAGDADNSFCTTTCTLRDAIGTIAAGGTIDFAPSLLPATITLTQGQLRIEKSMHLQGPGAELLAISAGGLFRVLSVGDSPADNPISVDIAGLTIRDGSIAGVSYAQAPAGSNGGTGGDAVGACIYVVNNTSYTMELSIQGADIRNCSALGGKGGDGGTGMPSSGGLNPGGRGGDGGGGGRAIGAAIGIGMVHAVSLTLVDTSISGISAIAGNGGKGGDGGDGLFKGSGGSGGQGGNSWGTAVFNVIPDGITRLVNTSIAAGTAKAGDGGAGGNGDPSLSTLPGGNGGSGGNVQGGAMQFFLGNLAFATVVAPAAMAGSKGAGGSGKQPGVAGNQGQIFGSALASNAPAYNGESSILSTVILGSPASVCYGAFVASGANLDQDGSCGANLHATYPEVFLPLDTSAVRPAPMPRYRSAIVDAATSCDYTTNPADPPLAEDEHGTPRPQGAQCDLGAIEAGDQIFFDGFGN